MRLAATGSIPVANKTGTHAAATLRELLRDFGGAGEQHRHFPLDKLGRQRWQVIEPPVRPTELDRDSLALDETAFAKRAAERRHKVCVGG